jgi:hypothetical protein
MSETEFTPYGWPEPGDRYLAATQFLDFDAPSVARFVGDTVQDARIAADWTGYYPATLWHERQADA